MLRHPAPPPKPYPLGPYLRAWQFLQYSSASCSVTLVESNILPHIPETTTNNILDNLPHLKHDLWNLYPPATRSSAAYTDLPHLGHFGLSAGLKGILIYVFDLQQNTCSWEICEDEHGGGPTNAVTADKNIKKVHDIIRSKDVPLGQLTLQAYKNCQNNCSLLALFQGTTEEYFIR
nr:unnamed protein product [Callosobruchus analis]